MSQLPYRSDKPVVFGIVGRVLDVVAANDFVFAVVVLGGIG